MVKNGKFQGKNDGKKWTKRAFTQEMAKNYQNGTMELSVRKWQNMALFR